MSQRSPKRKTLTRRARKATVRAREAVRVSRILGRDVEMAQVLVIALLTQANGEIAISKETIDKVARGDVAHEFEVVDGTEDGERVLRFKKATEPEVLDTERVDAVDRECDGDCANCETCGTDAAKESVEEGHPNA